ncbi:MAG: hypothetical protein K9G70_00250 [Prolixibacteraceae bacterium]|nr:hypothetical protein [Prolixibacteraceae bacterium]
MYKIKFTYTFLLMIYFLSFLGELKAQERDTIVEPKFIPESLDVATFKEEPDNFIGKILYKLTPKKLKYNVDQKEVYKQESDTIIVQRDTTLAGEFKRTESNQHLQLDQVTPGQKKYSEAEWDVIHNIQYSPPHETDDSLTKVVYGFHPFWMGSAYRSYYFSLLSRVAYFSYIIDEETGHYKEFPNWSTTEIVDFAHAQDCKVDISVSCHGFNQTSRFLTNPEAQVVFVNNIIKNLKQKNADGVNLNFEKVPAKVTNQFTAFVKSLSYALKEENPDYSLSICIPAFDWSGIYQIGEISSHVDLFILMGYDFSGKFSSYALPNAPLESQLDNIQIPNSINYWLQQGISNSKLILGVPYFGNEWKTESAIIPSKVKSFNKPLMYRDISNNYRDKYKANFDSVHSSMYMIFKDGAEWVQCWYDDENSLRQKYNYVNKQNLGGAAIWALGYDNGYPNLWHLISEKFAIDPDLLSKEIQTQQSNAKTKLGQHINNKSIASPHTPKAKPLGIKSAEVEKANTVLISLAYILVSIIIFTFIGFIIALFDYNVREVLFSNSFRVIIFFVMVLIMIQIILRIFDVLDDKDILFVIGILLGILLTTVVLKIFTAHKMNPKDLTP